MPFLLVSKTPVWSRREAETVSRSSPVVTCECFLLTRRRTGDSLERVGGEIWSSEVHKILSLLRGSVEKRQIATWDKSTVTEINSQQCTFHETATYTRLLNAFRSILISSTYISDEKRVIFWAVNRLNARWTNHSTSALIKYSTTDQ